MEIVSSRWICAKGLPGVPYVIIAIKELFYNIKRLPFIEHMWSHAIGSMYTLPHVIPVIDFWGRIPLFYRGGNFNSEKWLLSDRGACCPSVPFQFQRPCNYHARFLSLPLHSFAPFIHSSIHSLPPGFWFDVNCLSRVPVTSILNNQWDSFSPYVPFPLC